jgi:hypothetical protein
MQIAQTPIKSSVSQTCLSLSLDDQDLLDSDKSSSEYKSGNKLHETKPAAKPKSTSSNIYSDMITKDHQFTPQSRIIPLGQLEDLQRLQINPSKKLTGVAPMHDQKQGGSTTGHSYKKLMELNGKRPPHPYDGQQRSGLNEGYLPPLPSKEPLSTPPTSGAIPGQQFLNHPPKHETVRRDQVTAGILGAVFVVLLLVLALLAWYKFVRKRRFTWDGCRGADRKRSRNDGLWDEEAEFNLLVGDSMVLEESD